MPLLLALILSLATLPDDCRSERLVGAGTRVEEAFTGELPLLVEELWQASWGRTYASVFFSDSRGPRASVYSEGASSADLESLKAALEATLVDAPSPGRSWSVVIADGSAPALRIVEGFRTCSPDLADRAAMEMAVGEAAKRAGFQGTRTALIRVRVQPDGSGSDVRIMESSGDFKLDRELAAAVREMRFEPARLEGIPVRLSLQFPITVRRPGDGIS